jgi:hypothetical protein
MAPAMLSIGMSKPNTSTGILRVKLHCMMNLLSVWVQRNLSDKTHQAQNLCCFAVITSHGVSPLRHSQVANSWSRCLCRKLHRFRIAPQRDFMR